MSVLQQIIDQMFIDPDLLPELSEEQKQMIFCKIREEQIRRYNVREEELEKDSKKKKQPKVKTKKKSRNVQWLLGKDGQEWVWVLGEHRNDKSIEQILEEEAQEKARQLAEQEEEELRRKEEEEVKRKLAAEQERLEKERKEKEAEEARKREEMAHNKSVKEARKAYEKMEKEKKMREEEERKRLEKLKYSAEKELNEVVRRSTKRRSQMDSRSSEYLENLHRESEKLKKEAEASSVTIESEWKKQEEKAKAVEKEIQEIARRARDAHRDSIRRKLKLKAVTHMLAIKAKNEENPPLPPKNGLLDSEGKSPQVPRRGSSRPPKPSGKDSVVRWFLEDERPHNIGINPETDLPFDWFHGLIKRGHAEKLLKDKITGFFLVRVSERVWGYAISYRGAEKIKHFLIDSSEGKYQFFGIDQIVHNSLNDLVDYHKRHPISELGQELLRFPCKQTENPPDYYELFSDILNTDESTHL